MSDVKEYTPVRNQPVARFFYKGQSHTHPVRRTVVVIENKPNQIVGYELREGAQVRHFGQAPIKSYRKDRIARIRNVDKRRRIVSSAVIEGADLESSTLQRTNFLDLVKNGV